VLRCLERHLRIDGPGGDGQYKCSRTGGSPKNSATNPAA